VGYGDYYPVTGWGQSMAVILMFFGLGIIGVLSSYLASTFISLERSRAAKRAGEIKLGEGNGENEEQGRNAEDEMSINLEAELAALKEELAAQRQVV
jgi:Ion channel